MSGMSPVGPVSTAYALQAQGLTNVIPGVVEPVVDQGLGSSPRPDPAESAVALGIGKTADDQLDTALATPLPPPPSITPPPEAASASAAANAVAQGLFKAIDSSELVTVAAPGAIKGRAEFFQFKLSTPPPVIGKSAFVTAEMVEHLMRHKRDSAIGSKFQPGTQITNMEGALHTYVTPVGAVRMVGDYQWPRSLGMQVPFMSNRMRPILVSFAIHPDFENKEVMFPLMSLGQEPVQGEDLGDRLVVTSPKEKADSTMREIYDAGLRRHMVYHLTKAHQLPSLKEIEPKGVMGLKHAKAFLEETLLMGDADKTLEGKYVNIGGAVLSLEMLVRSYVEQVRNEFKVLNAHAPQGFVYTICPPSIFAAAIGGASGGATLLNRLQALAFQILIASSPELFSNLKMVGYNNYADKEMLELFKQHVMPKIEVVQFPQGLYPNGGYYKGPEGCALVLHNNSDAFGQNIETEGFSSMDGMIGTASDAALVVHRKRPDLVKYIV